MLGQTVGVIDILVVLVYLLLVVYLGWLGYSRTKTATDYLIAGRKVHPYVMAMSYGATFISTSAIVGFGGVAGMFAGHQHAARWRANGAAAVSAGKLQALCGQPINVGRDTIRAAIGRKISDPRVIDEDENNVGFFGRGISSRGRQCRHVGD